MNNRVAVVRGTFLRPGVSKNRRLYTKDAIAGAVNRMKEQLSSPNGLPLTMATGHGAAYADDATSFVGRVTNVALNQDGSASFEADIANTTQGRDVATLISGDNPFLKTISIRGEWLGDVENVEYEGQKVTTSKDFRIYGIDFTSRPGVEGAQIEDVELLSESAIPSSQILESFEEFEVEDDSEFEIDEADGFAPPAGVRAEAKKALQWIKDGHAGSGFTDVGRKRASDLAAGRSVSIETIGRISNFLSRHSVDKKGKGWSPGEDGFPSPGRVAYAAWGGEPAISWTRKILNVKNGVNEASDKTDYSKILRGRPAQPVDKELYARVLSDAKKKFQVYPSAVANSWVVQEYKRRGGTYRASESEDMQDILRHDQSHHAWHAMHGDPPCKNKAECDKMRAKYEAQAENTPDKAINMEKISELLSEMLAEFEEADTTPYGEVRYADPGYQKDGVKRYPIDTKAHARAAWSYINQESSAHKYTAAQLARVKSRIKSAAKQFGINIISEQEMLASELQEVLEAYASIALVNDDDSISITGYATDPHQLKVVANRIAFGAIAAMHAIDPDDDGDIYLSKPDWSKVDATGDAGGMGPEDEDMMMSPDDNNMESAATNIGKVVANRDVELVSQADISKEKMYCPSCNNSLPDGVTECSSCGESIGQCPDCGCMQAMGANECTECGASMMNNESDNSNKTKEALVADTENVTEEVTESAPEAPARLLTDADLKALAVITAEAVSAVMNAKEVKEQADPEDAEEAPAADAEPEVAADENTPEGEMAESYSADDLKKAVAEALDSFKGEVAEAYRENGAPRKGIVANEISEEDIEEAFSTERLATMGTREFREAQYDAWSNVPFFKRMFDQADGFGRF